MSDGEPQTSGTSDGELHEQLRQLKAELQVHLERQAALMRLLGTTNPARIEHDVRNIMNELTLYKSLMG
ncbi:MAG TPA: hypothetical protein PKB10_04565, partial [Tepidisphaeraceae bacterium]|nr:hypothetical protein [Tepidisphaeraceae bacterium]